MNKLPGLITVLLLLSCQSKNKMSLEELKKAEWDPAGKGIEFISVKETSDNAGDSLAFTFEGTVGMEAGFSEIEYSFLKSDIEKIIRSKTGKSLDNSEKGYLKINLQELIKPDTLIINVFLRDYKKDSIGIAADMAFIKTLSNVVGTTYISAEDAKKQFMEYEKTDFNDVLDVNPLPASFDVSVLTDILTDDWFNDFKNKVQAGIPEATEITKPTTILQQLNDHHIFLSYRRV